MSLESELVVIEVLWIAEPVFISLWLHLIFIRLTFYCLYEKNELIYIKFRP